MNQTRKSKILFYLILFSLNFGFIGGQIMIRESKTDVSPSSNECVDAWILIQGDRDDHEAWDLILSGTEFVYDKLLDCGFIDDDIYYLVSEFANESTSREDGITNHANLIYAFETWAPIKVGPNGVLGVYIITHGSVNGLCISPSSDYTDFYLNDDLEGFTSNSACNRIYVIIDSCHSGSFIDVTSAEDRIIVTSTTSEYSAYFSPLPPYRPMFTEAFMSSIAMGNSIGDAFVDATWEIKSLGYGQKQFPCVDDDHDGIGHIVNAWGELPSSWDGIDAKQTYICGECGSIPITYYPYFLKVPLKLWVGHNPTLITLPVSVQVANNSVIDSCFVRIVNENWFPPDPIDENATGGIDPAEDTYRHYLIYDSSSGNFTGIIELWSPLEEDYNLTYVVEDINGNRGPIIKSQIGINEDGIPPPDNTNPTVYISNVYDGEKISEKTTIYVVGNDEESGLEEISLEVNGEEVKTMQMPDYLPYPVLNFTLDPNEYKNSQELRITGRAKDSSGGSSFFDVFVEIDVPIKWIPWVFIVAGVAVVSVAATIVGIKIRKKKKD